MIRVALREARGWRERGSWKNGGVRVLQKILEKEFARRCRGKMVTTKPERAGRIDATQDNGDSRTAGQQDQQRRKQRLPHDTHL